MFYGYLVWDPERNCSGGSYLMTRCIRPVAGIAKATRMAIAGGFTLIEIGMEAQMGIRIVCDSPGYPESGPGFWHSYHRK